MKPYHKTPYRRRSVTEKTYLRQPLATRVIHWTFFLTMTAIAISGFYMHAPWRAILYSRYQAARYTHSIGAFILTGLFVLWAYFTVVFGAVRKILVNRKDLSHLPQMLRYILFLSDRKPPFLKYNPLQKLEFAAWITMFVVQAATGFILYRPKHAVLLSAVFWDLSYVRLVHYLVAVVWTASIAVHIYFAITTDFGKLAAMVIGVHKKKSASGQDEARS
ncbi:MAG: cytochrome b/b6 domain-containing protein [Bacillota bacterium]